MTKLTWGQVLCFTTEAEDGLCCDKLSVNIQTSVWV